jgi:hypothetical protein
LRAFVVLLQGNNAQDSVFLQLKQARRSCVAPFVHGGTAWHTHQGQRVVEYQQTLQTVSDPLLGWTTVDSVDNWMNVAGPVIMLTKMMVLTLIIMWVRFSYPRFREDQLQRFAWKVLIPLSLLNILVTAVLKVAV